MNIRRSVLRGVLSGLRRSLPIWVSVVALVTVAAVAASDDWYVYPPFPSESDRFGVGLAGPAESILAYDVESLGVGWYVNWNIAVTPPHPNGVAFMQDIRLSGGNLSSLQDVETIQAALQANPGAVWLIGNEPDSIWLDNCTPVQYAVAYNEWYHFVKAHDATAKVAFGGLVQATPLRILYLDRVWQAYQDAYGEQMPVDVWVVHGFIFPEVRGGWGADIPPGMDADAHLGMQYEIRDHDDMDIFAEQIVRFRQWMADHGQREKPLVVNEYGITVWPDIYDEDGQQFTDERVIAFMHVTFDYFLTATDPDLGYTADGNRLVQAWAWYSTDDDVYQDGQRIGEGYNGDLFTGAYTKTLTALGQGFVDYVAPLVTPYDDLYPVRLQAGSLVPVQGQQVITLTVEVGNWGREPVQAVEVQFWDGAPGAGGTPVGPVGAIPEVPGRYEGTGQVDVTWTVPSAGVHTVWAVVDPQNEIAESDEENNRISAVVEMVVDLLPVQVQADLSGATWGQTGTITLTAEVGNLGHQPAQEVAVQFWDGEPGTGGVPIGPTRVISSVPDLNGGTAWVDMDWTVPISGTHVIWVEVDPDHEIAEADEGNNRASTVVDMEVDLVPAALRFAPISPLIEGGVVTVTATAVVTHAGAVGIPGGVGAWFWMGHAGDGDPVVTRTLDGITPGGQAEVMASWTLTLAETNAGLYLVSVEIDPTGIVLEMDEGNNVLERVLLIGNSRIYLPVVLRGRE